MARSIRSGLIPMSLLLLAVQSASAAPITLTADPNDAWNIYEKVGVGKGNSVSYEPFPADYASSTFLGYYSDALVATGAVFGAPDEDTIRTISTYIYSDVAQNVTVYVGGDDGHTVSLNGSVVYNHHGGGPFGAVNLAFHAGVNTLEAAVYNGPGGSLIHLTTNTSNFLDGKISDVPGLRMNATGNFAPVPEPSSMLLWCIGGVLGASWMRRKSPSR